MGGGRFWHSRCRAHTGVAVVIATFLVVSCYSTPEVGTTGSNATSTKQLAGIAHVLDGDTIALNGERVRLRGIDTAEDGQRCGLRSGRTWDCAGAATARLRTLTAGRMTTCDPVERDRYGRMVAICRVGDIDVQEVLTREGLAWAYRRHDRTYVPAEEAALGA